MVANIIFYVLALISVMSAFLAVTSQKIIRSAVFLLFVLLSTAGFYFLLEYHFLAVVQLAVYAGGVMVLFIFAIFLTSQPGKSVKQESLLKMLGTALVSLGGLAVCGHIIFYNVKKVVNYVELGEINMQTIGNAMMGTGKYQNILPFEAISLLLLACIIGGIVISKKK